MRGIFFIGKTAALFIAASIGLFDGFRTLFNARAKDGLFVEIQTYRRILRLFPFPS